MDAVLAYCDKDEWQQPASGHDASGYLGDSRRDKQESSAVALGSLELLYTAISPSQEDDASSDIGLLPMDALC